MVGGSGRTWLALATLLASGALGGCGKSGSDGGDESSGGDSAAAGRGGTGAGGSSGGSAGVVAVAGAGVNGGASSGGTAGGGAPTCGVGGGDPSGEAGATECGLTVYPSDVYEPSCQAWVDENCCASLAACAESPTCKSVVDCINACQPPRGPCISCCATGIVSPPAELDAIAACTKSDASIPDSCSWPPS